MKRILPLIILVLWVFSVFIALAFGTRIFLLVSWVFLAYFVFKLTTFSVGAVIGYMRYRDEVSKDWSIFSEYDIPKQFVIVPVNNEDFNIVLRLLDSIADQTYPLELFRVVISIEAAHFKEEYAEKIKERYSKHFSDNISVISHTLSGDEVPGAAANRKHAATYFVDSIIEDDVSNYLVTAPDCDTVFHKKYFSRITTEYLQRGKPKNEFYQTEVYSFFNNVKDVNALIQVTTYGLTLALLSNAATQPKDRYTFSCFTMPLETLVAIGYWDETIPIDDSPLYWRAALSLGSTLISRAIFIPISVDATQGRGFIDTMKKQYEQFYRWAWGIIFFPQALTYLRRAPSGFLSKLKTAFYLLENIALQGTWVFVLTSFFFIFNQFIDSGSVVLHTLVNAIGLAGLLSLVPVFFIKLALARELDNKHMGRILLVSLIELPLTVLLVIGYGIYPLLRAYFDYAKSAKKVAEVQWAEKLTKIT